MRGVYLALVLFMFALDAARAGELEHAEANAPNIVPPLFLIGGYGTAPGALSDPVGLAMDESGRAIVADCNNRRVQVFDHSGTFLFSFGEANLNCPQDVAAVGQKFFVLDRGLNEVLIFNAQGRVISRFGGYGENAGLFKDAMGISADDEFLVVADTGNYRIQIFNHSGELVDVIDNFQDLSTKMLTSPEITDVTIGKIASVKSIFANDAQNNLVMRADHVDNQWKISGAMGEYGSYPGNFAEPISVSLVQNFLYVADLVNHRIQVFDASEVVGLKTLEPAFLFGRHPVHHHEANGRVHYPATVSASPNGSVVGICEPFENRCQVFNVEDVKLSNVDVDDNAFWDKYPFFHYGRRLKSVWPSDVNFAISADVLAMSEPDTHLVVLFDAAGVRPQRITSFGGFGTARGEFKGPHGVGTNIYGEMFVTDTFNNRVQVFDISQTVQARSMFTALGQIQSIEDQTLSLFGIDRSDAIARGLQILNPPVVDVWEHDFNRPSGGSIPILAPAATACGDETLIDRVYISDTRNHKIRAFTRSGNPVSISDGDVLEIGGYGTDPGRLNLPTDIQASRRHCTLFVVEAFNQRVSAFDAQTGEFIATFGTQGVDEGEFMAPSALAEGVDGRLYVTDQGAQRVSVWNPIVEGGRISRVDYVSSWGVYGVEDGHFMYPQGITVGSDNRIFVVDFGNHRGQVYEPDGTFVTNFGLEELQPVEATAPVRPLSPVAQ